ncbi:TPA: phosphoribosylaminoimidazole carboxylase [Streptococcus suis]
MIKIIVHAFVESHKTGVVEVVFASKNEQSISEKMAELRTEYPNDYLAIYDLPLDRDLPKLGHYPSVAIGKEEFE